MIKLGTCDTGCKPADPNTYFDEIHEPGMVSKKQFRGERDDEWLGFSSSSGNQVATVQAFLKERGFFPFGKIDGLCGYRTASSMRLFQEYVRSVKEDKSIGAPDGIFGGKSLQHMQRWQDNRLHADWNQYTSANAQPEYRKWMGLLADIKAHYLADPTDLLRRINAYNGNTDTLGVANWDFDPQRIHMIGIRRDEAKPGNRKNDDVFILLINGAVFKFYGTTDPGKSEHRDGAPFLVHGQHRYRFGWHKQTNMKRVYRALKPRSTGVLIIRDGNRDLALTQSDLEGSLRNNNSINVHWGGRGISNWSAGCQVICGAGYINHNNDMIDCSSFAATTYSKLGNKVDNVYQTKGAYSVLVDLVTAFSGGDHALDYTLVYEDDLKIDPGFGADMAAKISAVMNKRS
jgi:hypothetical protein